MSTEQKKWKIDFEYHAFKAHFTVDYFIIELDGKVLYILCSELCYRYAKKVQYKMTLSD
jgi:hypothetical protein